MTADQDPEPRQDAALPYFQFVRKALPFVIAATVAVALIGAFRAQGDKTEANADADAAAIAATDPNVLDTDPSRGPVTNLPLPRYVSLKAREGNVRRGPSLSHRIDWVFEHQGMPLKLTAEFGNWRRVEDRDGAGGWIHYTLISGVRTVVVEDDMVALHARPDLKSGITAKAQAGAIAKLGKCTLDWCEISAQDADGWVQKKAIWGVDPEETRD